MANTLEAFAGHTSPNYCTLPTVDVEILPDVRHCKTCTHVVSFNPRVGAVGVWVHDTADAPEHGSIQPTSRCAYCHSEDSVVFIQHAWYDAIECSRCGGVTGFAIGD